MTEETTPAENELPAYVIEAARSGRSKCKTCRRAIAKDALRLGVLIEGPYGTGYLWHHLTCAARRHFDRLEEAYALEAWKEAKAPPSNVPPLDSLRRRSEEAAQRGKQRRPLPHAELAPTARSSCKQCGQSIAKGSVRVVLGRAVTFGNQQRVGPINVHPGCVADALLDPDCATEADGLAEALREHSGDLDSGTIDALLEELGRVTPDSH